jgi:uncharacterized membrane protein
MNSSKSFFASSTVWGGLVALIAAVLGAFGYGFAEADQAQAAEWITTIAGGLGGIVAIIGRVRASKRIR